MQWFSKCGWGVRGAWEAGPFAKFYFHYVCCITSATPVELIGFTFSRSTALGICSVPAPAVRSPPEHNFSWILHRADRKSSAEITIWYPVTFQNKTFRVDTSTQISKKRQTQALQLILQLWTVEQKIWWCLHSPWAYHEHDQKWGETCLCFMPENSGRAAWNYFDNQVIVCRVLQLIQWFIQINK